MATQVGEATIKLSFDGKNLTAELAQVEKTAEKSGKKAGDFWSQAWSVAAGNLLSKGTEKLFNGTIGAAVNAGKALASTISSGGFDRALNIENAEFKLKGLGHSAEEVEGIMDNALASVKGTAFGLGDAATIAASAVASGIKPGQELERVLKLTADAAAIAGTDLSDMGAVFNKVAAGGKMTAEEMNQLTDRGIPMLDLLGSSLGKTTEDVREMVRNGEIGMAEFTNAIEQGMGGAALKMGESFDGAVENTKAALSRLGLTFQKPLMQGLTPILGDVIGLIDNMGTMSDEELQTQAVNIATNLGNVITELINNIGTVLEKLVPAIAAAIPALAAQLPGIINTLMPVITDSIILLAEALIIALPDIIQALVVLINALIEFLVKPETLQLIIEAGIVLFLALVQAIPQILGALFKAFQMLFGNLWSALASIFKTFAAKFGNALGSAIKGAINGVLTFLEGFLNGPINAINGFIDLINTIPGVSIGRLSNISLPRLAEGGIVTRATTATIGEAGKEAVIPLESNTDNWAGLLSHTLAEEMENQGLQTQRPMVVNFYDTTVRDDDDIRKITQGISQLMRRTA